MSDVIQKIRSNEDIGEKRRYTITPRLFDFKNKSLPSLHSLFFTAKQNSNVILILLFLECRNNRLDLSLSGPKQVAPKRKGSFERGKKLLKEMVDRSIKREPEAAAGYNGSADSADELGVLSPQTEEPKYHEESANAPQRVAKARRSLEKLFDMAQEDQPVEVPTSEDEFQANGSTPHRDAPLEDSIEFLSADAASSLEASNRITPSRRAKKRLVSLTEPRVNTKLRQGDPGTFSMTDRGEWKSVPFFSGAPDKPKGTVGKGQKVHKGKNDEKENKYQAKKRKYEAANDHHDEKVVEEDFVYYVRTPRKPLGERTNEQQPKDAHKRRLAQRGMHHL